MKCQYCEKVPYLPFKCPFCGGYYCVEHRLPENHSCSEFWRAKIPRRERPIIIESRQKRIPFRRGVQYTVQPKREIFRFSSLELKHLAFGALLVMGVGASLFWFTQIPRSFNLLVIFTSAFLLHEIAHKLMAQYSGLWAEFRLTLSGAFITMLSIISPVKIISPGGVMVLGSRSREVLGKVSLAGPLVNLMLSIIFFGFSSISPIFIVGCYFNAFIALINLIPFGMLDGLKVFLWNKKVWFVVFTLTIVLAVWAFTHIY